MNHKMRLFPENFEKVKLGLKCREYRLYDEKRQKIKIGDTITFINTRAKETVTVLVTDMLIYKDFKSCYSDFWNEDFSQKYASIEQAISITYRDWWSKELEEKYGCVVLILERYDLT